MFYLHFLDGSRCHRGSMVVVTDSDIAPVIEHNVGGSRLIDSNGVPQTFDNGWKLGPVPAKTNAKKLACAIAREYNYDAIVDGKLVDTTQPPSGMMTVEQAKDYASEVGEVVTGRAIRKAASNGHIPGSKKIGRDWIIPYDGFNHYLDNRPRPGRVPSK